jgi:hypothetical protein
MSFLRKYDCHVPFRPYRVPARLITTSIASRPARADVYDAVAV